jgi:ATP-dependent Clp protease adaptor protein ClpS
MAAPLLPAPTRETTGLPKLQPAPRWKVILLNDDEHDMLFVVRSLRKAVPGLTTQEAMQIMLQAHLTGRGLVRVCPREEAEYYQERIQSFKLGCTIEPDE